MTESSKDTGVKLALIERFKTQRLPRALALKEKVDRGELLSDQDLAFLERVFADAQQVNHSYTCIPTGSRWRRAQWRCTRRSLRRPWRTNGRRTPASPSEPLNHPFSCSTATACARPCAAQHSDP